MSSHDCPDSEARAIYYNSRHFGKTRNEKRITRWGRGSPLQNPENTGALTLLAFKLDEQGGDCKEVNIWVCASTDEEDVIETAIGEVIPGALISGPAGQILGGLSLQQAPVNHKYIRHCCKVSDEAAFCLIQRPYVSKTLLTRRISPRGSP